MHCYDCNSMLCGNCYVQGRYNDDKELFCFDCRRFSMHKNARYYFENAEPEIFNMDDDWQNSSWYY